MMQFLSSLPFFRGILILLALLLGIKINIIQKYYHQHAVGNSGKNIDNRALLPFLV